MGDSEQLEAPGFQLFNRVVYNLIAIALAIFVLVSVNTTILDQQPNLALFGLMGIVLIILSSPEIKYFKNSKHRSGINRLLFVFNWLLIAATILAFGYIFIQTAKPFSNFWIEGQSLGERASTETTLDFAIGLLGLILVLEATRLAIGWTLPILCIIFILYAMFGSSLPEQWAFRHRGFDWERIVQKSYLQSGGVFGIALNVMFKYVFLFVLFGTLLEQTGATGFVIRFAQRMFRKSTGAPAKVAVVSSGMMGSLSGSAVANTATTGTFTIPLMKSSGFDAESAAGLEAAASSGGALMPPIMGAGAYMMLEMIEPYQVKTVDPVTGAVAIEEVAINYLEIIQAALIPAILYYVALLLTAHFHARRIGARTESETEAGSVAKPEQSSSPFQGILFVVAFLILIAMLVTGFTPFRAVSVSLLGIVVLSWLNKSTRLTPAKLNEAIVRAAKGGTALIVAAGCVGIIMGIVGLTGIGGVLPSKVQALAGDSSLMALILLMFSTIVLGMGLPSAVCYLLMAILVGSVLKSLNTPDLAAHLFIFYFGMMSMVTPPVALAAYAGAAIAKANVMKSALAAFRFALAGFALPFAFVFRPELLMLTTEYVEQGGESIKTVAAASPLMITLNVAIILMAIVGLAAAIAGFAFNKLNKVMRLILLLASLTLFLIPISAGVWIQVVPCLGIVAILVLNRFGNEQ